MSFKGVMQYLAGVVLFEALLVGFCIWTEVSDTVFHVLLFASILAAAFVWFFLDHIMEAEAAAKAEEAANAQEEASDADDASIDQRKSVLFSDETYEELLSRFKAEQDHENPTDGTRGG